MSDPLPLHAETLDGLFEARVGLSGRDIAYREFDPNSGSWREFSWLQTHARVRLWRMALDRQGMRVGDRVAIQLRNSLDWVCCEQAALSLGLIVVPLFLEDAPSTTRFILGDSGARLLVIDSATRWEALGGEDSEALECVEWVVCIQRPAPTADRRVRAIADWLTGNSDQVAPPRHSASGEALATIVYTSGTTGRPRGAMLSHRNLLAVAAAVLERNPGKQTDLFLSYLPLAHIFERVLGYYVPMMIGARVQFARSPAELPQDLIEARPTILLLVPYVLEKLQQRIQARAARIPAGRQLLSWTVASGLKAYEGARDRYWVSLPVRLVSVVLRTLIADPILSALGGRIRLAVSGGAPLASETARFFLGLGLPLVEGYGLTEASSAVCGARLGRYVPGSVGPPLEGMAIRTGPDDEILVRSPGMMQGYWGNREATVRAMSGGWLHTGDVGQVRQGNLSIRHRLGETLVLSTGQKLHAPQLEAAIRRDRLFAQVVVAGHNRPHPIAFIVLDPEQWPDFATGVGVDAHDPAALASSAVLTEVRRRLACLLAHFPRFAQIDAVHLTLRPWTVDDGLLTVTLKPKRGAIEERFAAGIESLDRR